MIYFFENYLNAKNLRHRLFPTRDIDNQRSCNLIGQEHTLVNHLEVYAVHDKNNSPPLELK